MSHSLSRRASLLTMASAAFAQSNASNLDRVKVGSNAPAFDLASAAGGKVSLKSLRGKNLVLVFYRGYW